MESIRLPAGGQVVELDGGVRRWADVVGRVTNSDHRTAAGAGVAGAVGFPGVYALSDVDPDCEQSMAGPPSCSRWHPKGGQLLVGKSVEVSDSALE